MFTTISFFMLAIVGFAASRGNNKERRVVSLFDDELVRQSIVFTREDVKMIALLLGAILVMLGVIADKL